MNATYWQRGESLDYKNETKNIIEAGSIVVLGKRIGVAGMPIQPEETGSIAVTGVFEMSKDKTAIKAGNDLYYDKANDCIITTPTDITVGYAVQAAAANDSFVFVKLTG